MLYWAVPIYQMKQLLHHFQVFIAFDLSFPQQKSDFVWGRNVKKKWFQMLIQSTYTNEVFFSFFFPSILQPVKKKTPKGEFKIHSRAQSARQAVHLNVWKQSTALCWWKEKQKHFQTFKQALLILIVLQNQNLIPMKELKRSLKCSALTQDDSELWMDPHSRATLDCVVTTYDSYPGTQGFWMTLSPSKQKTSGEPKDIQWLVLSLHLCLCVRVKYRIRNENNYQL